MLGMYPGGGEYPWHTTKASMLELREDLGLAMLTIGKNILN